MISILRKYRYNHKHSHENSANVIVKGPSGAKGGGAENYLARFDVIMVLNYIGMVMEMLMKVKSLRLLVIKVDN